MAKQKLITKCKCRNTGYNDSSRYLCFRLRFVLISRSQSSNRSRNSLGRVPSWKHSIPYSQPAMAELGVPLREAAGASGGQQGTAAARSARLHTAQEAESAALEAAAPHSAAQHWRPRARTAHRLQGIASVSRKARRGFIDIHCN